MTSCNREFVYCYSQVTEPLGEAKTDQEIGTLLLEGMGMDPTLAYDTSEKQQFFEQISGCKVMGDNGKMEPPRYHHRFRYLGMGGERQHPSKA